MELQTVVTLLTITVMLLALVIIALIVAAIIVLIKLKQISRNVSRVTDNLAEATAWVTPTRIFSLAARIFRR